MTDYGLSPDALTGIQRVLESVPSVERAILYGSRAKGCYRPNSDIDLTVEGAHISLSDLATIEVRLDDLLLPYSIDLSCKANLRSEALLREIDTYGKIVYQKPAFKTK